MRDDPREILKAAGVECAEVDALWPLQTEIPRGGLYPDSVAVAILALARLVTEKQAHIERLQAMFVCKHLSATGVDTQPDGPEKVWRCDGCGFTYRNVPDGNGGFGWYVRVPVWDAEQKAGKDGVT